MVLLYYFKISLDLGVNSQKILKRFVGMALIYISASNIFIKCPGHKDIMEEIVWTLSGAPCRNGLIDALNFSPTSPLHMWNVTLLHWRCGWLAGRLAV